MTIPPIVCLCGSTRFIDLFDEAALQLTLRGCIVLSIGSHKPRSRQYADNVGGHKAGLDRLHKRKIDLADAVLVLDVEGYVGDSTRSEIAHAETTGTPVASWSEFEAACDGEADAWGASALWAKAQARRPREIA